MIQSPLPYLRIQFYSDDKGGTEEQTMITIPINTNTGIRIPVRTLPEKPKSKPTESIPPIGVSIPQAAKMLGVSKDTFLTLVKAGKVRTVRINKRVIVSIQSLREFVDGKKEPHDSVKNNDESHGRKD